MNSYSDMYAFITPSTDVQGIQMTTKKKLCNIKGLSEAKVEKIKVINKCETL